MQLSSLSPEQLRSAADLKERLAALQNEFDQLLGTGAPTKTRSAKLRRGKAVAKPGPASKRKMSAAGKKRLSQIARARWAKVKAAGKNKL